MESPPSSTTWSEAFILSDDSGLLLTSSSLSNGSMSAPRIPIEDSDCEEKSLSQYSLDAMSDIMCENFNTLKKGPHWGDLSMKNSSPIEPPLEFQDRPSLLEIFYHRLATNILNLALKEYRNIETKRTKGRSSHHLLLSRCYNTDLPQFSPIHGRPSSRSSFSSRLSSSHNSLSVPSAHHVDDSSFITQAVSHDTLASHLYNVSFDSDVYAVPVDVVRTPPKTKPPRKRRRPVENKRRSERYHWCFHKGTKRHSFASSSAPVDNEPIHMTLQEVRHYLQTLYSSSSDSEHRKKPPVIVHQADANRTTSNKKGTFLINIKNKKVKDSCDNKLSNKEKRKKSPATFFSFKQTLCNIFRFKKYLTPDHVKEEKPVAPSSGEESHYTNISSRALPPLPQAEQEPSPDFATSIQRVKDYGWYWGPLSSEVAEKILSNEPDGSFIVRDSSDDHYIFSLTFKLNNCVRHVRIDHDQGNFSFGSCTKFKSQTIVEFIENAVEHSRSGRYLFFLHRRPVIGPVRVQLLHPVSRFKQVQSLQHICRFAIHKVVRRDLIPSLPLPRRMIDYLNTPHYYSEHLVASEETNEVSRDPTPAFRPQEPPQNGSSYNLLNISRQS